MAERVGAKIPVVTTILGKLELRAGHGLGQRPVAELARRSRR